MKIVFTCNEENTLKFTVATPKEILFDLNNPHPKTNFKTMNKEQLLYFCEEEYQNNIRNKIERFITWKEIKDFIYENHQGEWTQEFEDSFYEKIIWATIPKSAVRPRILKVEDEPDPYFIEAWCDITENTKLDIDCAKAKDIILSQLRNKRQKVFEQMGLPVKPFPEIEAIFSLSTKSKIQSLRDITEPLKSLIAEGYNNITILNKIKELNAVSDSILKIS